MLHLDKVTRIALLYDFYGPLLTGKQQSFLELYYEQDLSLGEIAEESGVSRQAVYDLLKRTEHILEGYEAKLGLVVKHQTEQQKLAQALRLVEDYRRERREGQIDQINSILKEIVDLENN